MALNNVWLGQCRIWAREARFDCFASDSNHGYSEGRLLGDEGTVVPVGRVKGVGIKNVRVGKQVEGEIGEGEKIIMGKVEVRVEDKGRELMVRRVDEGVTLVKEEGVGREMKEGVVGEKVGAKIRVE